MPPQLCNQLLVLKLHPIHTMPPWMVPPDTIQLAHHLPPPPFRLGFSIPLLAVTFPHLHLATLSVAPLLCNPPPLPTCLLAPVVATFRLPLPTPNHPIATMTCKTLAIVHLLVLFHIIFLSLTLYHVWPLSLTVPLRPALLWMHPLPLAVPLKPALLWVHPSKLRPAGACTWLQLPIPLVTLQERGSTSLWVVVMRLKQIHCQTNPARRVLRYLSNTPGYANLPRHPGDLPQLIHQ